MYIFYNSHSYLNQLPLIYNCTKHVCMYDWIHERIDWSSKIGANKAAAGTTSSAGKYYITATSKTCGSKANVITSKKECAIALKAVGKSDKFVWNLTLFWRCLISLAIHWLVVAILLVEPKNQRCLPMWPFYVTMV